MSPLMDEVNEIIKFNTIRGSGFKVLHETPEVKRYQIFSGIRLTFWSGEIVISGINFGSCKNGIVFDGGYGLDWFVKQTKETGYLLGKCMTEAYSPHLALERLLTSMRDVGNSLTKEQRVAINKLRKSIEREGDESIQDAAGFVEFVERIGAWNEFLSDGLPYDYPRNAAAWLIAIQRVFAKAYKEHIEGKAA